MSKSKYTDLLAEGRYREPDPDPVVQEAPATPVASDPPALPRKGPGRKPGKKSDPTFEQVTAYLPRKLYGNVRAKLIQAEPRGEFSTLVADLLSKWLDSQTSE